MELIPDPEPEELNNIHLATRMGFEIMSIGIVTAQMLGRVAIGIAKKSPPLNSLIQTGTSFTESAFELRDRRKKQRMLSQANILAQDIVEHVDDPQFVRETRPQFIHAVKNDRIRREMDTATQAVMAQARRTLLWRGLPPD